MRQTEAMKVCATRLAALGCIAVLPLACCGHGAMADEPPLSEETAQEATVSQAPSQQQIPPELKRVLAHVDEANGALEDVRAQVTYVRAIPLLDEKQQSQGELTFKKPNLIALRLGEPRNEEVYTDGETWWVVEHDAQQVEVYRAAGAGEESREAAFLDFGYGKGSDALLEDYQVQLVSKESSDDEADAPETTYRLKFTPRRDAQSPARYCAIEVEVSDRLWLPHVLVLHESEGEIVHEYHLRAIRLNTGVEERAFKYEPPRHYTVVRPQTF